MPDYFSHGIAAEIIYEKLTIDDRKKLNKTLYLVGAQGGDIFFAYNLTLKNNLGKMLHRIDPLFLFEQLAKGDISYAAGFATHYALDATLHPFVYSYEKNSKSPLAHNHFENDLGLYMSKKFAMRRTIISRDAVLACTGPVYDSIKRIEPQITVTGVERCLKRHFAWTRYSYVIKRQEYRCNYDFTALSDAVDSAIELGTKAVHGILNGQIDASLFHSGFLSKEFAADINFPQ